MTGRIISTLLLWAALILLPYFLGHWGGALLVVVFGGLTLWEMLGLLRVAGHPVLRGEVMAGGLLLLVASVVPATANSWLPAIGAAAIAALTTRAFFSAAAGTVMPLTAMSLFAMATIVLPFALIGHIMTNHGLLLIVWIIAVSKFADVGGLLTGLWLGRHKMAPRFSPKKTWEGLAGGLLTALLVGFLVQLWFAPYLPAAFTRGVALAMALPVAGAAVVADLFESALKREAKVKDSGRIFPGIGGFFDLTDSFVFAFPVAWLLLQVVL
jgi:phosphatidate cytidylyltransferase